LDFQTENWEINQIENFEFEAENFEIYFEVEDCEIGLEGLKLRILKLINFVEEKGLGIQ
jgi:hypothetical protein